MELRDGYKHTELGVIPEDWGVKTIFEIVDKQKSLFDDGDWIEAVHITDDGIRLVQTGNIGIGKFIDKNIKKFIYNSSYKKLNCKKLRVGDLLICRLAEPAGRACIFPDIGEAKSITSVDVTIFRPSEKQANRYFLVQYFSTGDWFRAVLENVGGTTHKRISRSALGKTPVPIPPSSEQTAIANALSDADAFIQSLTHLIAKKCQIKQGAMQILLNPYENGRLKAGWVVKKLGDECELITKGTTPTSIGKNFHKSGINFIKIESVGNSGEILKEKLACIDAETHAILKRSQLKEGDILVSIAGALGRICIVNKEFLPANTNQALAIARLKQESGLVLKFVYFILKTERIKKHIEGISVQGVQANLSLQNIFDLPVEHPLIEEQIQISTILSDMNADIAALETKLAKTRQIKQGMMQILLTGKIRLV